MKKISPLLLTLILFLSAVAGSASGQSHPAGSQKKRIVVLAFENATLQLDNKAAEDIGKQIAAFTAARFIKEDKFEIVERERMTQLMAEMNTGTDVDRFDPKTAADIGKLVNANGVVMGIITEFNTKKSCRGAFGISKCTAGAKVGLTVRLVDVNTGVYISAVDTTGQEKEESTTVVNIGGSSTEIDNDLKVRLYTAAARKAVDDAVKKLAVVIDQKIQAGNVALASASPATPAATQNSFQPAARPAPASGPPAKNTPADSGAPASAPAAAPAAPAPATNKVVKVAGNTITVNVGQAQGATVGGMFVVVREDVTKDPDSGEVLDVKVQEVGRIKITEVRERISIGTLTSGGGVKVSDLVRPHDKAKP